MEVKARGGTQHLALSRTEIIFRAGSGFDLKSRSGTLAKFTPNKRFSLPVVSLIHLRGENATQGECVRHMGNETYKPVISLLEGLIELNQLKK